MNQSQSNRSKYFFWGTTHRRNNICIVTKQVSALTIFYHKTEGTMLIKINNSITNNACTGYKHVVLISFTSADGKRQ